MESDEQRRLQNNGPLVCSETTGLTTTYRGDTQAYGVMFTIRAVNDPITILTVEFSSIILAEGVSVRVLVYSREGSYNGFSFLPNAWDQLADTKLIPSRSTARGTLIPMTDFRPVEMAANETRAFYVTLDEASLRYSTVTDIRAGQPYVRDKHLEIHVGAGVLQYPFSVNLYEPRLFNGAIHYRHALQCGEVQIPTTETTVPMDFVIQHDDGELPADLSNINNVVQSSVRTLFTQDPIFQEFTTLAALSLLGVTTEATTAFSAEVLAECQTTVVAPKQCAPITSLVRFQHNPKILDPGRLMFLLLSRRHEVTHLITYSKVDAMYAGAIPVQSSVVVRLKGVPPGREMDEAQTSYYENIIKSVLAANLVSSFRVWAVETEAQRLVTAPISSIQRDRLLIMTSSLLDQRRQERFLQENTMNIDIQTSVMGEYRPPPHFGDFQLAVLDAIDDKGGNNDGGTMLVSHDELVTQRHMPEYGLSDEERTFFEGITGVQTRPFVLPNANASSSNKGLPWYGIFLLLLVFLAMLGAALYHHNKRVKRKRKKRKKSSKQEAKDKANQALEEYMEQMYQDAFGGFGNDSFRKSNTRDHSVVSKAESTMPGQHTKDPLPQHPDAAEKEAIYAQEGRKDPPSPSSSARTELRGILSDGRGRSSRSLGRSVRIQEPGDFFYNSARSLGTDSASSAGPPSLRGYEPRRTSEADITNPPVMSVTPIPRRQAIGPAKRREKKSRTTARVGQEKQAYSEPQKTVPAPAPAKPSPPAPEQSPFNSTDYKNQIMFRPIVPSRDEAKGDVSGSRAPGSSKAGSKNNSRQTRARGPVSGVMV